MIRFIYLWYCVLLIYCVVRVGCCHCFFNRDQRQKFIVDWTFCLCLIFHFHEVVIFVVFYKGLVLLLMYLYNKCQVCVFHVNVTQTVPDISPLMSTHQDSLLVCVLLSDHVILRRPGATRQHMTPECQSILVPLLETRVFPIRSQAFGTSCW